MNKTLESVKTFTMIQHLDLYNNKYKLQYLFYVIGRRPFFAKIELLVLIYIVIGVTDLPPKAGLE